MPSRRHCRQTGPIYLAKFFSPIPNVSGAVYGRWLAFVPLTKSKPNTFLAKPPSLQENQEQSVSQFSFAPLRLCERFLNSSLLRRPAAVVRHRRRIPNDPDFDARGR